MCHRTSHLPYYFWDKSLTLELPVWVGWPVSLREPTHLHLPALGLQMYMYHCTVVVGFFWFGRCFGFGFLFRSKDQTQGLMFMGQVLSTNLSLSLCFSYLRAVSQLCCAINFVGCTGHLHADLRSLPPLAMVLALSLDILFQYQFK